MNKKIAILESKKEDEKRIHIHPKHFRDIYFSNDNIFCQNGYAGNFGQTDELLKEQYGFQIESREKLLKTADIVFLLKPTIKDLQLMKKNASLLGWCHTVQNPKIANIASERCLTLIAMESMYEKTHDGLRHIFFKNNVITGREGVKHALSVVQYKSIF
jgi:alanine dehydrogenase